MSGVGVQFYAGHAACSTVSSIAVVFLLHCSSSFCWKVTSKCTRSINYYVLCRWQARRVDSVQTIESLAKNRIWRAVNTRDTDSTYDSRHGVLLKASWENEYIIDDSRAFYAKGSNGGLLAWQPTTANGMKVVGSTWLAGDSENVRNAERESAELLIGGRGREMFGHDEEHIYESIDEVRRGVDALNVAAADCETLPPDADETEKRV